MGWVVRKHTKRDARGRSRRIVVQAGLNVDGAFDTSYNSDIHHQGILSEIRLHTSARRFARNRKYDQKVATLWKEAILRDAPLLRGFFAEEPNYRPRMLRCCEKILGRRFQ